MLEVEAGSGLRLLWAMGDALACCGADRAALAHFEAAMEIDPELPEELERQRVRCIARLRGRDSTARRRTRRDPVPLAMN